MNDKKVQNKKAINKSMKSSYKPLGKVPDHLSAIPAGAMCNTNSKL